MLHPARSVKENHPQYRAGYEAGLKKAAEGEGGEKKPPTMAEIKKMDADEINARWDEIHPVLQKNGGAF